MEHFAITFFVYGCWVLNFLNVMNLMMHVPSKPRQEADDYVRPFGGLEV